MSKNGRFSSVNRTIGVNKSKKIAREADYLDLDHLDLDRTYTLEEFEIISNQLKICSLKINGETINHFELDKSGKLVPMPPTTIDKEAAVANIVGQLDRWNVHTGQNGVVTCSQGGFRLETGEIRAPDVAFTPKEIYRSLTEGQRSSFQGPEFSPTFVVEVADVKNIDSPKFKELDSKFKDTYFDARTSVELGWLIDPIYDEIWVYKRNSEGKVFRRRRNWGDLDGGDTLPDFTLRVWKIKDAMSQESLESSESEDENTQWVCNKCSQTFNSGHLFMEHTEDEHLRKKRIRRDRS